MTAGSPSYEINPLLNIGLNKARTIAEILSFGVTLAAFIVRYSLSTSAAVFTINAAQLLARNFQLQGTCGGKNSPLDFDNPVQEIGRVSGTAYRRSFTIGFNYLVGRSEAPAQ